MTLHNRYSISFLLYRNRADETGAAPLICKIRYAGKLLCLSSGYRVNTSKWESSVQRCALRSIHGKNKIPACEINEWIERATERIRSVFLQFDRAGVTPTPAQLRAGIENDSLDQLKLLEVFDKFYTHGLTVRNWSRNTCKRYTTLRNHLSAIPGLTLARLAAEGAETIIRHTQSLKNARRTTGLNNRTTNKLISQINTFLRWAHSAGYCSDIRLNKPGETLRTARKPVVFLTWQELMTLYDLDLSASPHLAQVRDAFCLCCFTSLRYSDLARLRKTDITADTITITTQKTADRLTIDLNKYSRAILQKYADTSGDAAIPVISNQKMNDSLKELGRLARLDAPITETIYRGNKREDIVRPKHEMLTTHAGRRTFICNALMLGIAPSIVMKWTGHSDYAAMRPYIDIAQAERRAAMQLFDDR